MFAITRLKKLRMKGIFISLLLVSFVLVAYFFSSGIIRFLIIFLASTIALSYLFYKLALFFTSEKGSRIAYTWSEIVYSLFGVPVLLVSIFYFPLSLFFVFVNGTELNLMIKTTLLTLMVICQVISLVLFMVRIVRDRDVYEEDVFEFELQPSIDYDYIFSPIK
jgi:hypothetical protein